jgi:hypothetical protein
MRDQTSRLDTPGARRQSFDRGNNPDFEGRMQGAVAKIRPIETLRRDPNERAENCALLHAAI